MFWVWLLILTILLFFCWLVADKSGHKWVYRNPYSRTCTVCDRQEDYHCWAGNTNGRGWWEEMREGAGEKCKERNNV